MTYSKFDWVLVFAVLDFIMICGGIGMIQEIKK
jgi:hypothetical protein